MLKERKKLNKQKVKCLFQKKFKFNNYIDLRKEDEKNGTKKDPFKTDKPLYDYSIEYDYSSLPNPLKEIIKELEEFDVLVPVYDKI